MMPKLSGRKAVLIGALAILFVSFVGFDLVKFQPTPVILFQKTNSLPVINTSRFMGASTNQAISPNRNPLPTLASLPAPVPSVSVSGDGQISASVRQQISALLAEKTRLTPVQQKISSHLLDADKIRRGVPIAEGVATLRTDLNRDSEGRVLVDIKAEVTPPLLQRIVDLGGKVISNFPEYQAIQASLPLAAVERLAADKSVIFVEPADRATHGSVDSEGDYTHQAQVARTSYGATGAGVKVGVISDSADYLSGAQIATNVTVVSGQSGVNQGNTGEGTAMLEIVNDLAPGAKLYFASDGGSQAQFAANIRTLRYTYGCDIIVDDILYQSESPFQDSLVAQAVNEVTANGAMYFASAGNAGSLDAGTSGTWEGDFVDGGAASASLLETGQIHSFGSAGNYDTVLSSGNNLRVDLFWADPWSAAANDYDVFVLDAAGTTVVDSSRSVQNGRQNPYESISTLNSGERIVIVKYSGASCFLHLSTGRGRLSVNTAGATRGHNCAVDAIGVAATDAQRSYPGAFAGGGQNPVERFSSDGPRRVFFEANGTPITPGDFSATGGTVRFKPDLTAADGVTTDVPGFQTFYGTSAAAPHAAAIAALVKSYNPTLNAAQIRAALTNSALDIMNAGFDRDSGAGIVMAPAAVIAANPFPDLTKYSDSLSSLSPHLGDTVTASLTITNQYVGVAKITAGKSHVGFYWSASDDFSSATPFYETPINGCVGGGIIKVTQTIATTNLTVGTYYLGYKIDDKNEVAEANEANNGIYSWAVTILPDITPPACSIIAPKANQLWSNGVFTVAGKTTDKIGVASVFCSVNGGDWLPAGTTNNWGSWTVPVPLTPGTNQIAAYAVDTTGNFSPTNFVKMIYVESDVLTVTTNGRGSVTPNYNGALLALGKNYSLTAKAATGFAFTNWTDGSGAWLTNGPTLKFLMASNLALTANFTDITRPTLTITNLKSGQKWSNEVFMVNGKTVDNVAVTNVFYSLNGSTWQAAVSANFWSNWTAQLTLVPGTNTLFVLAVDAAGNRSLTNTVKFLYALTDALTVQTNGRGSISPNYNGVQLQIGANFSMTAKPATGFAFKNWTDGSYHIVTNGATLKFLMASNLTFAANFVDVARPTLTITNPSATKTVADSFFTISGKAADNVAVTNVFYSLNSGAWQIATSANLGSNWSAPVILFSGTNRFRAFAMDAAGNLSSTNTATIICTTVDPAPATLNGLLATLTPDSGNAFAVGFGTNLFSQSSADTNGDNGVGIYSYTKFATNAARLVVAYMAPPTITNNSTAVWLTFSNPQSGTYSNEINGLVTGEVMLMKATNWAPTALNGKRIICLDAATNLVTLAFGSNTYTQTNDLVQVDSGTYFYRAHGPVGGLITLTGMTGTNYVTIHFADTNAGVFFSTFYDRIGNPPTVNSGAFIIPAK